MNERIKELAEQAKFMAEEDINRQISYNAELKAFAEKFAELIVKECADIANRQFSAATGLDDRDCLTAHQMKQHFGVDGMSTEDKKNLIKQLLGVEK
jgi:hypothetical protein